MGGVASGRSLVALSCLIATRPIESGSAASTAAGRQATRYGARLQDRLAGIWHVRLLGKIAVHVLVASSPSAYSRVCLSEVPSVLLELAWPPQLNCLQADEVTVDSMQLRHAPVYIRLVGNSTLVFSICEQITPQLPATCRLVLRGIARGKRGSSVSALDMAHFSKVGMRWLQDWESNAAWVHTWGNRIPHDAGSSSFHASGADATSNDLWQRLILDWHTCDGQLGWKYAEVNFDLLKYLEFLDELGYTGIVPLAPHAILAERVELFARGVGVCLPLEFERSWPVEDVIENVAGDVVPLWLAETLDLHDLLGATPALSIGWYLNISFADGFKYHVEAGAERLQNREEVGKPPVRVAFCLRGGVRSFIEPVVYESIRDNLTDALAASESYFFYVLNMTYSACQWCGQQDGAGHLSFPDLVAPLTVLPPAALVLEPRYRGTATALDFERCTDSGIPQWAGLRMCGDLVETFERQVDWKFDWFVRLRPDVRFHHPLANIRSYDPSRIHVAHRPWSDVNDGFALVPRVHMWNYLGVFGGQDGNYHCYSQADYKRQRCMNYETSCQLRDHLAAKGLRLGNLPIFHEKVWVRGTSDSLQLTGRLR